MLRGASALKGWLSVNDDSRTALGSMPECCWKRLGHMEHPQAERVAGWSLRRSIALARLGLLLVSFFVAAAGRAHGAAPEQTPDWEAFRKVMTFEGSTDTWERRPQEAVFVDSTVVHGGAHAIRLEGRGSSADALTSISRSIPIVFSGAMLELRGFLRTEDISGFAGLWIREDDDVPAFAVEDMRARKLPGATGWAEYSVSVPIRLAAHKITFGVMLSGGGTMWADDLQLLVDDKPVWDAPRRLALDAIENTQHEFDKGSGITIPALSSSQIDNLNTLGKVWGFLKYHHPAVTSGKYQWDFELFRVLPAVLAADSRPQANEVIQNWIDRLGDIPACTACARLADADLSLPPALGWLNDEGRLGAALSSRLRFIYANRVPGQQFYVSLTQNENPQFEHEPSYDKLQLPDAGLQLLALYRFWNVVAYWYPYRDLMAEDWDRVLDEFLPRIMLARDREMYELQLMALIARVHDSRANLWNALDVRPPRGSCQLPVSARFIEEKVVIGASTPQSASAVLRGGDIVSAVDGVPASSLLKNWAPYYAASNETVRYRDMMRTFFRGPCGHSVVGVVRDGRPLDVNVERVDSRTMDSGGDTHHDLSGDAFQLLSDRVAYLKLSSVKSDMSAEYVRRAAGTDGLVIDIRNYPSEFVVHSLGPLLVEADTTFVRFTHTDLSNPGAFYWSKPESLTPREPHYPGKVVILVDETSMSQAEYAAMAFRAAPRAVVVGSNTAGTDGNVSPLGLPGGLQTLISGLGVFYPDGRPTQRVGIVPDILVKPTMSGIRAGRDEILERALREILGPNTPSNQIERLYRH
jgi:C-terminal processing protease CtpA/Prc